MRLSEPFLIFLIFGALCIASSAQLPDNMKMESNCNVIKSAENASVSSNVGPGNPQVTFILSWLNSTSNLDMVLSAPDGKLIDSNAQAPDLYMKNDTMIQFTIPEPEPGNWTAKVTAKTTPEFGEGYCVITIFTLNEMAAPGNETGNITGNPEICPTCSQPA